TARADYRTARRAQKSLKIGDFRLCRAVLYYCIPVSGQSGHHEVFRSAYAGICESYLPSSARSFAAYTAPFRIHFKTQLRKSLYMYIHGSFTYIASAGSVYDGFPASGEQTPHQKNRRPHLSHKTFGNGKSVYPSAVYDYTILFPPCPGAQSSEYLLHGKDVAYPGAV